MLHGFNFLKIVFFLSTVVVRIKMPVILAFFNIRDIHSRCAAQTQ